MTKGEKSSLAARKRLKEIKRTVQDGMGGTRRQSFYGATKEEAEASYRDYCQNLSRPPLPKGAVPIGSISWWLRERYMPLKAGLRDSSREALVLAGNHLEKHLGQTQAKDVRAVDVAAMLAKVGKSASLRNKVRTLALDVMELASEEDGHVRPVSRRRVARAKESAPKIDILSPQEARALVASVAPNYRPAVAAMAFLGLRSGEAIAFIGRDLTPVGTLTIRRQDDGFRSWTSDLKTEESRRELPVPAGLWDLLVAHRVGEGEPVSRTGTGRQIDEAVLRRAVAAARERLGLPPCPGHTLHSLRHGCSTWLATNGCPDAVRLAILGQSRGKVVHRYVHAGPAEMLPYLDAMWAASEGGEGKRPERKGGAKTPAKGERNGRSKISDAIKATIPARLAEGATVKGLARELGVTPKAIRNARASAESVVATTTHPVAESPASRAVV